MSRRLRDHREFKATMRRGLGGVVRRSTPGHVETLARHGSPLLSAIDGDGAPIESWFSASDLASTADGRWLAAQVFWV